MEDILGELEVSADTVEKMCGFLIFYPTYYNDKILLRLKVNKTLINQ